MILMEENLKDLKTYFQELQKTKMEVSMEKDNFNEVLEKEDDDGISAKMVQRVEICAYVALAIFLVFVFSIILSGCSTLEKYLPNTVKAVESSATTLDDVGTTVIERGKKDLVEGVDKAVK